MTVRRPRPADEPAIRSLQALLDYADPEIVDAALDGPFRCRVAVADGAVVGYAIAFPGDRTLLSELAVAPGHRRVGHGRDLAAAVAGEVDRLQATTPVDNDAALAFYDSLGFEADDRLEAFYGDGTDALRLVRRA